MNECRWDRETDQYLTTDGEACDVPRREHCTARRTCSHHLGWGELTCARCLGRVRQDIRQLVERAPLVMFEALAAGVNSEAAALAGPTCDPEAWSWHKVSARQGVTWHLSLEEDDDETDPERVLTTWAQMLSEDYQLPRPDRWDIVNAGAFLDRIVHRVAQDEEQDFRQFRREIGRARNHVDSVLRLLMTRERGVPCPICAEAEPDQRVFSRLQREYPHWCDDPDCERIHVATDELDVWRCPRNPEHVWTHADYSNRLEERERKAS